ncbi:tRNA pseudouridine synthase A isoform X1 [Colias croceus]|uniref:tRNA pseudouridine synthase A isoform X1 n=2 Tax=Colias crocea TaxID=72248 RepID=UPI001E27ABC2|nr:tRNA pseudouridine synthase A isoform X1 [Colias croceus]
MSVRLFHTFINTLRSNLPKHANFIKTGRIQVRQLAMSVASENVDKDSELVNKQHTRYHQRQRMKRQWEFNDNKTETSENGESDAKKTCDQPFERIKRKKMAVLLGYCGVDYYGMQRNPGVKTIEEDLLIALRDAKYITEEDFVNQQNAQFQRSSRTDKGVSAARQVVSLKLPLEVNTEEINKRLPECIRVFGIKRVTNKFNSKSKCNARTYSYTLPTYVFEPNAVTDEERKLYRITGEKMNFVNELLSHYKGTKSYHNFTEKKHYQDPSASRYMMSFSMERTFIESEVEFAEMLVKGQSFMLHQIRKMIGLVIVIARGQAEPSMMERVFGKDKVMIPTAPGLGLMLDKVHYERYDAKFKDSHESLTWDDMEEEIELFKRQQIHPTVIRGEIEGKSMACWLEKVAKHSFVPNEDVAEEKTELGEDDDEDDETSKVDDKCDGDDKLETNSVKTNDEDDKSKLDVKKLEENNVKSNEEEGVSVKCDGDEGNLCKSDDSVSVKLDKKDSVIQ